MCDCKCGCRDPAVGLCKTCSDYYAFADETFCARERCRSCKTEIHWGRIHQGHYRWGPLWQMGFCDCREWRHEQTSGGPVRLIALDPRK